MWNPATVRWERYCFKKFFDGDRAGENGGPLDCVTIARQVADEINRAAGNGLAPLVHHLPTWAGKKPE